MLTGCDVKRPKRSIPPCSRYPDSTTACRRWLFDPNKLAPTYPGLDDSEAPKFNAYYDVMDVKPVDGATWRLELSGLIADKRPWTLPGSAGAAAGLDGHQAHLRRGMELYRRLVRRAVAHFSRTRRRRPPSQIRRVQNGRRLPEQHRHGDGAASADVARNQYGGETLADPFGYPIRLRMATKLGYKNPKWITAIEVTNTYPGGYWESKGFPWFAGI